MKRADTPASRAKILAELKATHLVDSWDCLQSFKRACNSYLHRLTDEDMAAAVQHFAKCRKENKEQVS